MGYGVTFMLKIFITNITFIPNIPQSEQMAYLHY